MNGDLAAWISIGSVSVLAASALALAGWLLGRWQDESARRLLGVRLLGSVLLASSLAVSAWGLAGPVGSSRELAVFVLALAGVSLHLLDVPFALARTSSWDPPRWLAAAPLALPVGLLVYASQHWPATSIPAGARPIDWAGWAGRDAVEDAAGGAGTLTLGLAIVAATIVLVVGALRQEGAKRARARRMLAQAWFPVLVWMGAVAFVWTGLAVQGPPASGLFLVGQEVLLDGAMVFVLVIVGPLLWALDELEAWPWAIAGSERVGQHVP